MGLSKIQIMDLLEKIQYVLDNPIKQIEWEKISHQFSQLLEHDIEYDEEEIQYALRKLKLPDGADISSIYVIADELLFNYKLNKNLQSQMIDFEKENPELVHFLQSLKWPYVNVNHLSYEIDHWFLINGFEDLLKKGIEYHVDDIRNWLSIQSNSMMSSSVIEEISKIAEFTQLYFRKPN